jgi:glycosyltransferase involved in cell wall biosynthesis
MGQISFIVSVFERIPMLNVMMECLDVQTVRPHEIIVCDNSLDRMTNLSIENICYKHAATHLYTGKEGARNSYESANIAARRATGEWLCFPSHDDYYVPSFSQSMLDHASNNRCDLVYCDFLINHHRLPVYDVLRSEPIRGYSAKAGFIIRKDKFTGFVDTDNFCSDGISIEQWIASGVSHGKAPGVLYVHN